MSATTNREIVEQLFAEMAKGNGRPFVDAMADEFCWTVMGHSRWSRSYDGKRAVVTELFGMLGERMAGRMKTIAERIIADGELVVVEARGDNMTKSGMPYCNRYCFVIRVVDGKLRELREYCDTEYITTQMA